MHFAQLLLSSSVTIEFIARVGTSARHLLNTSSSLMPGISALATTPLANRRRDVRLGSPLSFFVFLGGCFEIGVHFCFCARFVRRGFLLFALGESSRAPVRVCNRDCTFIYARLLACPETNALVSSAFLVSLSLCTERGRACGCRLCW